jgi:hypothetical protein
MAEFEYARRGVANAGLTTGVIGTALGALNSGMFGGLFGGNCGCSENTPVNRYELNQEQRIADLQAQISTDQKLLEVYKYFDGKIEGINHKLCEQAVWNATQTSSLSCMAAQIAQLQGLTKLVIPNGSVYPGWGNVTVTPATTPTTAG